MDYNSKYWEQLGTDEREGHLFEALHRAAAACESLRAAATRAMDLAKTNAPTTSVWQVLREALAAAPHDGSTQGCCRGLARQCVRCPGEGLAATPAATPAPAPRDEPDHTALRELAERWTSDEWKETHSYTGAAWEAAARELLALLTPAAPGPRDERAVWEAAGIHYFEPQSEPRGVSAPPPCQDCAGIETLARIEVGAYPPTFRAEWVGHCWSVYRIVGLGRSTSYEAPTLHAAVAKYEASRPRAEATATPVSEPPPPMQCVCAAGHDGGHIFTGVDMPDARGGDDDRCPATHPAPRAEATATAAPVPRGQVAGEPAAPPTATSEPSESSAHQVADIDPKGRAAVRECVERWAATAAPVTEPGHFTRDQMPEAFAWANEHGTAWLVDSTGKTTARLSSPRTELRCDDGEPQPSDPRAAIAEELRSIADEVGQGVSPMSRERSGVESMLRDLAERLGVDELWPPPGIAAMGRDATRECAKGWAAAHPPKPCLCGLAAAENMNCPAHPPTAGRTYGGPPLTSADREALDAVQAPQPQPSDPRAEIAAWIRSGAQRDDISDSVTWWLADRIAAWPVTQDANRERAVALLEHALIHPYVATENIREALALLTGGAK